MGGGEVDDAAKAAEADGKGNCGTKRADPHTMPREKSWDEAVLTNLEDDISAAHAFAHSSTPMNAPRPSLMADSKDMGHSAGEPIEPPPPPTVEEKKHFPRANEVTSNEIPNELFDHEILFDDCRINIPALDDGSAEHREKIQGWMNRRWIDASDKVLSFTSPVLRVSPSRYLWSSAVYEVKCNLVLR